MIFEPFLIFLPVSEQPFHSWHESLLQLSLLKEGNRREGTISPMNHIVTLNISYKCSIHLNRTPGHTARATYCAERERPSANPFPISIHWFSLELSTSFSVLRLSVLRLRSRLPVQWIISLSPPQDAGKKASCGSRASWIFSEIVFLPVYFTENFSLTLT